MRAVHQAAVAKPAGTSTSGASSGEVGRHYVMLDVAAVDGDPGGRHTAAQAFPHDRAGATRLFRHHGRRNGGSLPWVIQERYHELIQAFQSGEEDAIVRAIGCLLHFVTDAALPFNTTADPDGIGSGALYWSVAGAARHASLAHHSVRHRCQLALICRLRSRFDHEVRVAPERFRFLSDPSKATLGLLLDSHRAVNTLLSMDADTLSELGITDAETFAARADAYYARLSERAAAVMELRLEDAALLGASLIGTAWAEAGSPSPSGWTATRVQAPEGISPPPDETDGSFVGARRSRVFHRAACSHARRIKPTNLVKFGSSKEAVDAGRKPCKSCRPDGS